MVRRTAAAARHRLPAARRTTHTDTISYRGSIIIVGATGIRRG
jgi:hypothetical protein